MVTSSSTFHIIYSLLHKSTGLCIEEQPFCTCSPWHTLSCTCTKPTQCSCELPQVASSRKACSVLLPSLTNPNWLVEGALVLGGLSDPTHVHLGKPPSWRVPPELPSLEGWAAHCSSLRRASSWICRCLCICWFDHTAGSQTSRWWSSHCLVRHAVQTRVEAAPQWVLAVPPRQPTQSSCHVEQN